MTNYHFFQKNEMKSVGFKYHLLFIYYHLFQTYSTLEYIGFQLGEWNPPPSRTLASMDPVTWHWSVEEYTPIDLGKLYFANLKRAAILGWFLWVRTWFQGSGEQWGGECLPRLFQIYGKNE